MHTRVMCPVFPSAPQITLNTHTPVGTEWPMVSDRPWLKSLSAFSSTDSGKAPKSSVVPAFSALEGAGHTQAQIPHPKALGPEMFQSSEYFQRLEL